MKSSNKSSQWISPNFINVNFTWRRWSEYMAFYRMYSGLRFAGNFVDPVTLSSKLSFYIYHAGPRLDLAIISSQLGTPGHEASPLVSLPFPVKTAAFQLFSIASWQNGKCTCKSCQTLFSPVSYTPWQAHFLHIRQSCKLHIHQVFAQRLIWKAVLKQPFTQLDLRTKGLQTKMDNCPTQWIQDEWVGS